MNMYKKSWFHSRSQHYNSNAIEFNAFSINFAGNKQSFKVKCRKQNRKKGKNRKSVGTDKFSIISLLI